MEESLNDRILRALRESGLVDEARLKKLAGETQEKK